MSNLQVMYESVPVSSDTALTFGTVELGATATLPLTIYNDSDDPAVSLKAEIFESDFLIEGFPETLQSRERIEFTITYTPLKVDALGINKTVVNMDGKIMVKLHKELKGLLRITGEIVSVRYE